MAAAGQVMTTSIVSLGARPDLVSTVASWLWREWGRHKGRTIEMVTDRLTAPLTAPGFEQTFARLSGDIPVATASLVNADLDARPDLSPWLAGVFVDPPFRGQGHAAALVRAVEDAARARGVGTLWLHTEHAAGLYAGLGWEAIGPEMDHQFAVTLMRRVWE
ncbi:MAG: GNAT family N-acetyltransferase [Acetobacteraceae bacterium]|nr:GNAT family N-acetyltransferase [Acetobacteraceae bacterium]